MQAHENAYQLINELSFCVFDLETTGGNHLTDKIIEIGLVRIRNLEIFDQKSFLIKPEIHIPDFIQKLTSIKEIDVQNAPLIEDVIEEVLEFIGDSILVAHNTSFDVPFLNSVLKRLNLPELKNKSICTNLMTKYMIPNILSSNLNYMSKIFKLKHQKAHRALDDASASADLLLKYLSIFIHKDIHKINALYYPKNKFELDRINFKKSTPIQEISSTIEHLKIPSLITIKGAEGVVLFSIPIMPKLNEIEYVLEKIKNIPFETLTIKLIGPFFQGLIEMSSYFSKISGPLQIELIQKLCEFQKINLNLINDFSRIEDTFDFVIMNHLVPEQYIIYPLQSFHQKLELVFRYPSHQNKLVQYINIKSNKINQNKLKKDHLSILIHNFILIFLQTNKETLLIKRSLEKITTEDFKSKIESFILENPNNYNFPQDYL